MYRFLVAGNWQFQREAAVSPSSSGDRQLLTNRRSRFVFVARVLTLLVTSGLLAVYGFGQLTRPVAKPVTAPQPLLPSATALPTGILAADVQAVSLDGLALLDLPKGTEVLNAGGLAILSITITPRDTPMRSDIAVVGLAYELGPEGTTLEPPATLTFAYDPTAYWPFAFLDVNCDQLHMSWVSSSGAPVYPWLDVIADSKTHRVSTKIDHFGTIMLFCEVFGLPIS
jgi:hypothetical protein